MAQTALGHAKTEERPSAKNMIDLKLTNSALFPHMFVSRPTDHITLAAGNDRNIAIFHHLLESVPHAC